MHTVLTNHLPRLTAVPSFQTAEGTPRTFTAAELLAAVTDADVDDSLTIKAPNASENGGSITASADGASFTYMPTADFAGNDVATFVVSDGKGTVPLRVSFEVLGEALATDAG